MAGLTSLPDDILIEILLLAESPRDLLNTILAHRRLLHGYGKRRGAIIRSVVRRDVQNRGLAKDAVLTHVNTLSRQCRLNADRTCIYEGVRPIMLDGNSSPPALKWALKLCHLYTAGGQPSKRLPLLEHLYPSLLHAEKHFELDVSHEAIPATPTLRPRGRLGLVDKALCRELCSEYAALGRLTDQMDVQKQVLQRLELKDADHHIWGGEIVKTYRILQRFQEALDFEKQMYDICASHGASQDAALNWARLIVTEHTLAGRSHEALRHQKAFLDALPPNSSVYIAWARQLIAMQNRAGLAGDAVATKYDVWQRMTARNSCYYGWTRELAHDLRRTHKVGESQAVLRSMFLETQRQLSSHPKDNSLKYHMRQASRALDIEGITV
ncbi:hypothetical protein DV738_g838, partial [Chaetothyriales sp. CBS 135597]